MKKRSTTQRTYDAEDVVADMDALGAFSSFESNLQPYPKVADLESLRVWIQSLRRDVPELGAAMGGRELVLGRIRRGNPRYHSETIGRALIGARRARIWFRFMPGLPDRITVLHELAHFMAPKKEVHGSQFRDRMLLLVGRVMGPDARAILDASYARADAAALPPPPRLFERLGARLRFFANT